MGLSDLKVDVAGGGVAGLAAARALALAGAEVHLYEKADAIAEVGAGLQISPNGFAVLDALGLAQSIRDVSLPTEAVILRNHKAAQQVLRLDLRDQKGFALIHRARLIDVLAEGARAAGVEVHLGQKRTPDPADGRLLIGADGLHSAVRQELNGATEPGFTGQVAWRAVIADDGPGAAVAEVFMGPGRHLVSYPMRGGLRNIVAVQERRKWAAEGWHHKDDEANLKAAFESFGGPVPAWLDAVEAPLLWGLFKHPVAQRWHDGARVLVGDAAHPTLPFLAQGANMALEDVWVLRRCLEALPLPEALSRYQALRQPRTVEIVQAATANARNYHLSGPKAALAHAALRLGSKLAPNAALRRFSWLYAHDVRSHPEKIRSIRQK